MGDNGKHPSSLGQRGEQSWAESWPVIGPMIYNIMGGGEAVWFEDQKLPLYRDGRMDYAYWTYSFSPLADDTGAVNGVLVTCSETTKAVEGVIQLKETNTALQQLLEQNRTLRLEEQAAQDRLRNSQRQLLDSFEQSPVGSALLKGEKLVFEMANPFYSLKYPHRLHLRYGVITCLATTTSISRPAPLTPATLATYLSDVATRHRWATITRRLAAIRKWHRLHGHPDPGRDEAITTLLEGIKRTIGTQPDRHRPST